MDKNDYLDTKVIGEILSNKEVLEILRLIGFMAFPVVTKYTAKRVIKNYNLNREYRPKNITVIEVPPLLLDQKPIIDNEEILKKKYSDIILRFIDVIKANFKEHDLANFYHNVNTLITEDKEKGKEDYAGYYSCESNTITLLGEVEEDSIFHELFHMASSQKQNDVLYSGFKQFIKGECIGKGLNEGYTQLLTQRYFNCENNGHYPYHVEIMEVLEKIVGKEKMESLYLHADLMGLTVELNKYMPNDEIMRFIADMDYILVVYGNEKKSHRESSLLHRSFINVNRFLTICYVRKVRQEIRENKLSVEDGTMKIFDFVHTDLPATIRLFNKYYDILADDDIKKYMDEALEKKEVRAK